MIRQTGANAPDCKHLLPLVDALLPLVDALPPLVDALPPLCIRQGRRHYPHKLHADKAYDTQ